MPFGIAVLPDSVFDLPSGVLAEVYKLNVVLVRYSMLIPYLMLVLQTTLLPISQTRPLRVLRKPIF